MKYDRVIHDKNTSFLHVTVDVYSVLEAFNVTCPALQHLAKKALCAGLRGHKDIEQDLRDIIASANRALELHQRRGLGNITLSDCGWVPPSYAPEDWAKGQ